MKQLLLFGLCLCGSGTWAQGWSPMGSRSMSMANASVTLSDVWAFHHNPGALGAIEECTVGASYENRFLLKELQSQGVAAAIPLKVGLISVGGQSFGYRQFRTIRGGLGYSMQLTEKFYAGVQVNYQMLQLSQNYGSRSAVTGEAGIYTRITNHWDIGASVFNIGRARLADAFDDRFTTLMRLGTSYRFSDKLLVVAEGEKDLDYDPRFKLGIEYQTIDNFFLRGGAATAPPELSFGLGYALKTIDISAGSAYHQILGWSPNFSLTYSADPK